MNIILKIDGVDKSNVVVWGSVKKDDNLNNRADGLTFNILKHPGQTFRPSVVSTVELFDGTNKIFGGVITGIEESFTSGSDRILNYSVTCKDNTHFLERKLVLERYDNMSVQDIISALVTKYSSDFTIVNVGCSMMVKTISFNRITMSDAIQKLAEMTNYSWYVDYDKDIHFFAKNDEPAPFNLTDTSDNYIFDSLVIRDDISQLRNKVTITGGESEGNSRTEKLSGDGIKLIFPLATKFSKMPTIKVNGVSKIIGADYISDEATHDCFWSYGQKYIRFKDTTIPSNADSNIELIGIPLYPIIVEVNDPTSMGTNGTYEFAKDKKDIKSQDEAIEYAKSELKAYASTIKEAEFETNTPGLRSGQTITINSTLRSLTNEAFLIQSVKFSMVSKNVGVWKVSLASLKTVGIIDILQKLLYKEDLSQDESQILLTFMSFSDQTSIADRVVSVVAQTPPYYWGSFYWGLFTWHD